MKRSFTKQEQDPNELGPNEVRHDDCQGTLIEDTVTGTWRLQGKIMCSYCDRDGWKYREKTLDEGPFLTKNKPWELYWDLEDQYESEKYRGEEQEEQIRKELNNDTKTTS